jgi:clan AA aspartic protease (TIGR02281 family)
VTIDWRSRRFRAVVRLLLIGGVALRHFVFSSTATEDGPRGQRLVVPADAANQCYVAGSANGTGERFLIDTGAWIVSFPRSAVRGLGLDPSKLVYNQRITTANGVGKAANIRLRELRIGSWVLHDVPAQVDYNGIDDPLIGASVLKLAHLQFTKSACILTLPI